MSVLLPIKRPWTRKPGHLTPIKPLKGYVWQFYNNRESIEGDTLTLNGDTLFKIVDGKKCLYADGVTDNATGSRTEAISTGDFTFTMHLKTPSSYASFHYCAGIGVPRPGFFLHHTSASDQWGIFMTATYGFGNQLLNDTEYVLTWMRRSGTIYGFYNNKIAPTTISNSTDSTATDIAFGSATAAGFYAENNIFYTSLETRSYSDAEILARHSNLYGKVLMPRTTYLPIPAAAVGATTLHQTTNYQGMNRMNGAMRS